MAKLLIGNVRGPQGAQGATGPTGPQGAQGNPGPGVPTGGTAGQLLVKASGTNYDTQWQGVDSTPTSGSQNPVTSGGVYAAEQAIRNTISIVATGNTAPPSTPPQPILPVGPL